MRQNYFSDVNLPVPLNMLVLFHITLEIPLLSFTHSARAQHVPFSNDSTRTMCPFSECPPCPFFRLRETLSLNSEISVSCFLDSETPVFLPLNSQMAHVSWFLNCELSIAPGRPLAVGLKNYYFFLSKFSWFLVYTVYQLTVVTVTHLLLIFANRSLEEEQIFLLIVSKICSYSMKYCPCPCPKT